MTILNTTYSNKAKLGFCFGLYMYADLLTPLLFIEYVRDINEISTKKLEYFKYLYTDLFNYINVEAVSIKDIVESIKYYNTIKDKDIHECEEFYTGFIDGVTLTAVIAEDFDDKNKLIFKHIQLSTEFFSKEGIKLTKEILVKLDIPITYHRDFTIISIDNTGINNLNMYRTILSLRINLTSEGLSLTSHFQLFSNIYTKRVIQ